MHILHLNPAAQLGGAETSLYDLLANSVRSAPAWKWTLVLGQDGPLCERMRSLGVNVIVLPMPEAVRRFGDSGIGGTSAATLQALAKLPWATFSACRYVLRLRKLLTRLQPDLVHATGFKMHLFGGWAAPAGIPVLWHIHDYVQSRALMSRLIRWSSSRASYALANSNSVAADVRACCGAGLDVVTFYNFLNLQAFTASGESVDLDELARMTPARDGVLRVGLVATFARWKGHLVFLKALSLLPPELPVRGYIIGGPIYDTDGSQFRIDELKAEAQRLGIADRVGFTGFLPHPQPAIRALDVVAHASTKPEPMGMVILEGMGCEKPVIATRESGAAELFEDGKSVLAYPAGDAEAMAAHIRTLAGNASLRMSLGQAARKRVEEKLNASRQMDDLMSIYRRVRSAGGKAPVVSVQGAAAGKQG